MSHVNKSERRPSHEFLSELSIGQKMRISSEKHHLKLKLDKLASDRRRSLNVIDTESRVIRSSLMLQRQQQYQRLRQEQYNQQSDSQPAPEEACLTPNQVPRRSASVDLTPSPRKRPITLKNHTKSASVLRRRNSEYINVDKQDCSTANPERVLALAQRRHSDSTVNQLSFTTGSRPIGKRFSFSQTPEPQMAVTNLQLRDIGDPELPSRRMSMPVLFPNLNARASPRVRMSRSPDDKDTPRPTDGRQSMYRRLSLKREPDIDRIAGMHGVMQRTSIFQIQENEAREQAAAEAEFVN